MARPSCPAGLILSRAARARRTPGTCCPGADSAATHPGQYRSRRNRLRRPRHGSRSRRFRQRRHLRRHRREEDRGAPQGADPDLRAGPRQARQQERQRGPAEVHDRAAAGDPRRARHLHRRRHAAAAGRLGRSALRRGRRAHDRPAHERAEARDHEVDRSHRYGPDDRDASSPKRATAIAPRSSRIPSSCAKVRRSKTS